MKANPDLALGRRSTEIGVVHIQQDQQTLIHSLNKLFEAAGREPGFENGKNYLCSRPTLN